MAGLRERQTHLFKKFYADELTDVKRHPERPSALKLIPIGGVSALVAIRMAWLFASYKNRQPDKRNKNQCTNCKCVYSKRVHVNSK